MTADLLRLTILIHGDSGTGKSWLGASAPGPRLHIDAEGRGLYLPGPKVWWDPRNPPPELTDWQDITVIVDIRSFADFKNAYAWLEAGKHPFNSVTLDSLPEIQSRCMDNISGTNQPTQQDFGVLLREIEGLVRKFRDLRTHPIRPLLALIVVSGSHEKNGKQRPMLVGQMSGKAAYHFDVVGYLSVTLDHAGVEQRNLLIKPIGLYEAKDNTHLLGQHYGHTIINPNVSEMLAVLNAPPAATPGAAA